MAIIGVLMDPIETIKPYKDSTFAMMLAAQEMGHNVQYFKQSDMFVENGIAYVTSQDIKLFDRSENYYELSNKQTYNLDKMDAILMRKDPPFDMEFIYC